MTGAPDEGRLLTLAQRHLAALAGAPRPAGSEAEQRARGYCAGVLRDAGFTVESRAFTYSTVPGRWATSLGGLVALLVLGAGCALGAAGRPGAALATLVAGLALLGVGARWIARAGVLRLPMGRAAGVNLVATRGGRAPAAWLVAHVDSKSQPVPILVRAAGIVVATLAAIAAVGLAAGQATGANADARTAWWWIGAAALAGALPIIASVVGASSDGAVDNASGVAAALVAAAELPPSAAVGVLVTSAEELGLAGARAWVAEAAAASGPASSVRAPAPVLNVDGVDDAGTTVVMYSGTPPARIRRALVDAARQRRVRLRGQRLIPGVLADSVAFSDAGWDAVTVSRGTLATLARIHRPADRLAALDGRGVAEVGPLLALAAASLASTPPDDTSH